MEYCHFILLPMISSAMPDVTDYKGVLPYSSLLLAMVHGRYTPMH